MKVVVGFLFLFLFSDKIFCWLVINFYFVFYLVEKINCIFKGCIFVNKIIYVERFMKGRILIVICFLKYYKLLYFKVK